MQRSSLVSAFVIAFLAGAHFAGAQKVRKEPPRPALIAGADTNDARLFRTYLLQVGDDYARRNNLGPGEVQFAINRWLMDASPSFKAWRAYGDGRFPDALRLYAEAIKDAKFKAELRADRGRLFFQVGEADSALTELTQAVDELRKADKKDLVYVYESKALLEHSIGLVQ